MKNNNKVKLKLKSKSKFFSIILIVTALILFSNICCVSATNFTVDQVGNASTSVQMYVEANHQLPNNVTIAGTTVTMPQFLKLETTAIYNINNNITTNITLASYNNATSPSETITTTGNLTKTNYLTLANNVISFMDSNGRAPNYQSTSLGNMRYENLVYTFSEIMNSYMYAKALPDFIVVRPWTVVSNNSTVFITMSQISNAADTVQFYVEKNHQLPSYVTITGSTVNMPQFLKLEMHYIVNGNGNLYQSIPLGSYNGPPNPSESITGGQWQKTDYLNGANYIISFMDTNGRALNCLSTTPGNIRYENLVYIYAELINSANRNLYLPNYINLIPWTTVSNTNTVFLSMDQINTASWTVQNNVETNHALPSNVTIGSNQVNMQDYLKLEIMSIKNIYVGLYQSIILINYNPPTPPITESVTAGKENYENYMNLAENIRLYMNANGKAPSNQTCNVGTMRFENLVYMYAQLLNYYNVNTALPSNISVNPWSVVIDPNTVTFNAGQVISGAESVISTVETTHDLPINITISGTTVSMSKFLKLAVTTVQNINGNLYGQIVLGSYNEPGSYSETVTGGSLNKTDYLTLAKDVENFIIANGRGPAYQSSSLGNIHYKSLVYMYSQILSSYKANDYTLPDLITIRPWSVVHTSTTKFFTIDQIETAATTVKTNVETNHILPTNVIINNTSVSMPKFLKLVTTALVNINGKLNATIVYQDYNAAPSPSETNTGGSLSKTDYLSLANNIISFMDTNGRAPNYQTITLGNVRYESLVFMYSQILAYESTEDKLPESITVDKWGVVSNTSNTFFTLDQIKTAAANVQSYVESHHDLPATIDIGTTSISRAKFLQLMTTAVQNANGSLLTSFFISNYTEPPTPSESITDPTFNKEDYISLANDVMVFMYANNRGPNYKATSHGNIQYQSLIYMFSQILNSNNATDVMPQSITIKPWVTVSNPNTKFFTLDQIKTAAETVKNYVDANHQLPANVTINGQQVLMQQFLKLSAQSVVNIENYLKTSVILETVNGPSGQSESITSGTIYSGEFVDMAKDVVSYIDSHSGTAPGSLSDTSLGDTIRYESLIYMFSKILISYDPVEHAPDKVSVVPWLVLCNSNGTFNFRTQEMFSSIQAAIDDAETLSGDTIWLGKLTYTENVAINKKINIRPVTDLEVTVQALNPNLPVFTINNSGSGSTIRSLTISGSTSNAGVYINNSNENNILKCTITGNNNGVYIYNSTDNLISGNNISNNTVNGVLISSGSDNTVSENQITDNNTGINIQNSNNKGIYSNNIMGNVDGIHLNNASIEVKYNIIAGNSRYGLYNEGTGTVDATNNWWGSNSPIVSSTSPSDIYIAGGTVIYNPYLVLAISNSTDRSDRSGDYYNYLITADLTHNNQGDVPSGGNIPDDIPINFNTTLGTISSSATTKKGKAELTLSSTSAGNANVSATLDNQTVTQPVTITSINVLGVLNTRTQETFATIQEAIDDVDTRNGDTITLAEGTYTENVRVNKKLTIQPVTGAKVIVKADDSDKSVFVMNNEGSGTTIQNLNIIGTMDSYGVSLSHAYNVNISNNTISNSKGGIYLYYSGNSTITGNTLENNYYGIELYKSTSNNITGGIVKENEIGIYLFESNNNQINGSTVTKNWYGTYFYHSSNNTISNATFDDNWVGVYLLDTNYNCITDNSFTNNGVGITTCDSIGVIESGNTFTDNWLADKSFIDSGQMIMASTIYSCGPASLANVLKSLGIFATEAELAELAGTDETGTSLEGLKNAAHQKGTTTEIGATLSSINQLEANYIVVLTINGHYHFDVVQSVNANTITLFDPNLGIIELSQDKFNELWDTKIAFIVNDTLPPGATPLDDESWNIKAMGYQWVTHSYWVDGYYYWDWEYAGTIWIPQIHVEWVPTYWIFGYYNVWIDCYPQDIWYPVLRWAEGYYAEYEAYEWVPDEDEVVQDLYVANSPYYHLSPQKQTALVAIGLGCVVISACIVADGLSAGLLAPLTVYSIAASSLAISLAGINLYNTREDPWVEFYSDG